ncbi:glutathione S-transferase C-terminal domain-containing protein [Curvivirga sp.]|uniref:glutathione S-transferase C-terminal domain-containing protein n=1 Tax=Curvivirga sp. TaxID=2856848 RepID=UPI003B593E83
MGMLIDGKWTIENQYINDGRYNSPSSLFTAIEDKETLIQSIIENASQPETRYWIIGSNSCPWSQRCLISYNLLELSDYFHIHIAHGERVEGYALDDGQVCNFNANFSAIHLHQLYTETNPNYSGRVTVPLLWDNLEQRILCNESSEIVKFLDDFSKALKKFPKFSLFPADRLDDIQCLNTEIHTKFSTGVYRAGFSQSQEAYEEAVQGVFEVMRILDDRLSEHEYLLGPSICISDINLFSTLIRFDLVYHILHRCSLKRLTDFPNLWSYAKRLYQLSSFQKTVNFDVIKHASYKNDTANNPYGIIPITNEDIWVS